MKKLSTNLSEKFSKIFFFEYFFGFREFYFHELLNDFPWAHVKTYGRAFVNKEGSRSKMTWASKAEEHLASVIQLLPNIHPGSTLNRSLLLGSEI